MLGSPTSAMGMRPSPSLSYRAAREKGAGSPSGSQVITSSPSTRGTVTGESASPGAHQILFPVAASYPVTSRAAATTTSGAPPAGRRMAGVE